ncbi:hypothetical protein [Marinilactibacillus sp. 15R]|nr:hypothetical protein [Marinilactibacillus sp. 15R]
MTNGGQPPLESEQSEEGIPTELEDTHGHTVNKKRSKRSDDLL